MPEGPEIRRAADSVGQAITNHPLTSVSLAFDRLRPFEKELEGQRVVEVSTHGKAMLTRFERGLTLYSHNQLYGVWSVQRPGVRPKTKRSLRVALCTQHRDALLYSASDVDVLDRDELAKHPFLSKLGPDALWESLSPEEVASRLRAKAFRGRQLGALLLDQSFVAGLGNYLRSEILFDCGLRHDRRPRDLAQKELRRLSRSVLAITRRSYRTGGVTVPPRLAKQLRQSGLSRARLRFAVFDRESQPCRACDGEIQKASQGSRRIYWCPRCQN